MENMRELIETVKDGDASKTRRLVKQLLAAGVKPHDILYNGLLQAMSDLGAEFNESKVFIAEVLLAGQAWNHGYAILRDIIIKEEGISPLGSAVIATVEGDIHDIGKNLVGMFLNAAGFEIIDLGVDVSANMIVEAIREYRPDVLALSALLTVTMKNQELVIQALQDADLRSGLIVLVGGAPITREYCKEIGADYFANDAAGAAVFAQKIFRRKVEK